MHKPSKTDFLSADDLDQDLGRRAIKGGSAVMAAELISAIARIVSISILARLLVPEDFGLIAMVTALSVFAERFKDVGLGDATVQSREISHQQVSNLFWINFGICLVIAVVLASGSSLIARFYGEPRLAMITVTIASTFIFSGLVIQHQALLRRRLHFGSLSVIQIGATLLSLVVAIVCAYLGYGYWALVARELSRAFLFFAGTWILCPWKPSFYKRGTELSRFITFGKNVTGFNLAYFFAKSLDKILLGKLQGPYWVGIYTNAFHFISMPVSQIQYPVNTVAFPALSALQSKPDAFNAYFDKIVRFLSFLCMPGIVFLAVFADKLVLILLGPGWENAIPIFRILAIGAFIEPAVHTVGPAMLAAGKSDYYLRVGLLESGLRLGCLVLGSFWGAIGIAAGYTGSTYLALFIRFRFGLRHTPVKVSRIVYSVLLNGFISLLLATGLIATRHALGYDFALQWLGLYFLEAALIYLALWLLFPQGRLILAEALDFAKSLLRP